MATKFATREVLVLATEDDCSGRSNSENRETELSMLISTEGLEDVGAVWEKPFQDQDLVASLPEGYLWLLRMNYRMKIT